MTEVLKALAGPLAEALEVGAALGTPKDVGIGSCAVVPEGYDLRSLEEFQAHPNRKAGKVIMDDGGSFIRYFNAHANEHSQIYAKQNPPVFVGLLDEHQTDRAGWRDHRRRGFCCMANHRR